MDSINDSVEALGTLGAWKTIGLVGAVTAMKERIDNVQTSGGITVALVASLLAGTFALGGVVWMVKDSKEATDNAIERIDLSLSGARAETTAQIDAIMESANANTALLASSFTRQLDLSHEIFISELKQRDIKLDIAYTSASQGSRYTGEMASKHEDEDEARAMLCDARYYETKQAISELQHNCKDTMDRIVDIETQHTGLGYHASGNEK